MTSLGIDIGSSSVKVSLLDISSGKCLASVSCPQHEMPIDAAQAGWAEQDPGMWWDHVVQAITQVARKAGPLTSLQSIGITYQMHGLVCLGQDGAPLRKAIIWCDSRAIPYGAAAYRALGGGYCQTHTLNSPGNFTAAKLAWVKHNEPEVFARMWRWCLPGDYIAYKLSGELNTTATGLSEQVLWDFKENALANPVAEVLDLPLTCIPELVPCMGYQAKTGKETERLLGIPAGTPISYRAGDQPNNAFSLNVMDSGEVAATAGTSGVVYGVTSTPKADSLSRVNTFLHVAPSLQAPPRYGVLLCLNGTGILYAWLRRLWAGAYSYPQMNALAQDVAPGSEGVSVLPFGNGAERMLENRYTQVHLGGVDLNRHGPGHLFRAAQEGIAFSLCYGMEIMSAMGLQLKVIRAGEANLFLSPVFRETLATLTGANIELFNTDGSLGAARGAAWGAGLYAGREACFASLKQTARVLPRAEWQAPLQQAYQNWKDQLQKNL